MSDYTPAVDFDLDTEAKAPPLVPAGNYHAAVTSVAYDPEKVAIVWTVTLNGNGGVCSDDETEIDGIQLNFTNWLPKPGDKDTLTSNGKSTKHQSKVNMLNEFANKMKLTQRTGAAILSAVENAEYIGMEVEIQVGTREWQGSIFNEVKRMFVN